MVEFSINLWAVLTAGIANMVLGALWYGPILGKLWLAEMGYKSLSAADLKKFQERAKVAYPQAFIGGLLMVFVFAHVLQAFHGFTPILGIQGAFWMWLGFIVPVKYGNVLWYGSSLRLFLIDVGYYLVSLSIASLILTMWK